MRSYLDFEKPVAELDSKVDELRALAATGSEIGEEIARIEEKAAQALADLYANLSPWQKTLVARHPLRPHLTDFINALITEFTPLAGDRKFGEDEALMGGFGRFRGESICVIGQEKGATTESRIKHNFGMARPEGYRKAVRLMEMADRFGLPVLSIVDSAGAYPGIGAEERGQAEAIARSTDACLSLGVPNIAIYDAALATQKWKAQSGQDLRSFTFTRGELADLLTAAGFRTTTFFAALPDYKLPRLILPLGPAINDHFEHGESVPEHDGHTGQPLAFQAELQSHYRSLARLKIAQEFVPSFFVICSW